MDTRTEPVSAEREALRCANCRITLRAERVVIGGSDYCCEGCAAGGPCSC